MAENIPETMLDLLTRQKKALGFLAFVRKDGSPQVNPIWFDWDGQHIIINTARGRVKDRVLHRHPRVSLAIADPDSPERYVEVRGHVVEETEVGAFEMICRLNEKYNGKFDFPKRPGEVRVTYKILPEQVSKSM
jgi:PPOX class probable F420-dependent enzyme